MPAPQSPASPSGSQQAAPGSGLRSAPEHIDLLANTGLQFIDLEFSIDWGSAHGLAALWGEGFFVSSGHGAARKLTRLLPSGGRERRYSDPVSGRDYAPSSAEYRYRITDALKLFNEVWLPLPYQVQRGEAGLGPSDWARVRITQLPAVPPPPATAGTAAADPQPPRSRYCITLVFDTRLEDHALHPGLLSPMRSDLSSRVGFALQWRCPQATDYLRSGGCGQPWVSRWCQSAFTLLARERLYPNKGDTAIGDAVRDRLEHEAHYLNLLTLLGAVVRVPRVLLRPGPGCGQEAVGVSVFMDLQPDRIRAVFAERQAGDQTPAAPAALHELGLRDLGACEQVHAGPLSARAELCRAYFSPDASQACPGHPEAFCWTSLVRLGPEAERLADAWEGRGGRTGLACPLQALGQEEEADGEWLFNPCSCQVSSARLGALICARREPAVLEAVNRHLTTRGEALFAATSLPHVLSTAPRYAGRAFTTLLLLELLLQATVQVNGFAHRSRSPEPGRPRLLESVAAAMPPSMTAGDREQLRSCLHEALGVLWKCLGYDGSGDRFSCHPAPGLPLPRVHADCDAGQALQALYLHHELGQADGGRIRAWLQEQHPQAASGAPALRLASLAIGWQRTELSVHEYVLDDRGERAPELTARALLREGLPQGARELAGAVAEEWLLPAVMSRLAAGGRASAAAAAAEGAGEVAERCGPPPAAVRRALLQAAWALPDVLGGEGETPRETTLGELLAAGRGRAEDAARALLDWGGEAGLLQTPVSAGDARRTLEACLQPQRRWAGELVHLASLAGECGAGIVLLSGRAAELPGMSALLRSATGLETVRLVTVAENAVRGLPLCMAGTDRSCWTHADFAAAALDAETSLRYFGLLDEEGRLPHAGVRYVYVPEGAQHSGPRRTAHEEDGWRAVRYHEDGGTYEPAGHDETFTVTLPARWGGRRLAAADAPAVPLYAIELIADPAAHPEVRRARSLACPGPEVAIEDFVCQLAPELREDCRRRLQDVANDLKQLEARLIHERGILLKDLEQDADAYAMAEADRARGQRGLLRRMFEGDRSAEIEEHAAAEYVRIHTPERVEQVLARRRTRETRRLQLQRLACIRETLRANIELTTQQCTEQLQQLRRLLEAQHGTCVISVELYRRDALWQQPRAGTRTAAPRCRLGRAYCGSDGRDYSDFMVMHRLCPGPGADAPDAEKVRNPGAPADRAV